MSPERKDKKITPAEALRQINKRIQRKPVQSHSRLHAEGAENALHKGRMIRDLCGTCTFATITQTPDRFVPGKVFIALHCAAGLRPINIAREIPLGSNLTCPSYRKKPGT